MQEKPMKNVTVNLPPETDLPNVLSEALSPHCPAVAATPLQWATLLKALEVIPWARDCAPELVPAWAANYPDVPAESPFKAAADIADDRCSCEPAHHSMLFSQSHWELAVANDRGSVTIRMRADDVIVQRVLTSLAPHASEAAALLAKM
jgi:hypothetical protein